MFIWTTGHETAGHEASKSYDSEDSRFQSPIRGGKSTNNLGIGRYFDKFSMQTIGNFFLNSLIFSSFSFLNLLKASLSGNIGLC